MESGEWGDVDRMWTRQGVDAALYIYETSEAGFITHPSGGEKTPSLQT
jgi:hypothetical protein